MKDRIQQKIEQNLEVRFLEVKNNSYLHRGHIKKNNLNDTGDTHFKIIISAPEIDNLPLIKAHRLINDLLQEEFKQGLHALEIQVVK